MKTKILEKQCETFRTGREFRDHQGQYPVFMDKKMDVKKKEKKKKMDVQKGGEKELMVEIRIRTRSSDPMFTHFSTIS